MAGDESGKTLEIADGLLQVLGDPPVVDIPVDMDEPVSESRHRAEAFTERRVEEARSTRTYA